MGWNKVVLEWKEPKIYRRAIDRRYPHWKRIAWSAGLSAMLCVQWKIAALQPAKRGRPPVPVYMVIPICILGGPALVYGLTGMLWLCANTIRIREKGVARTRGNSVGWISVAKIDHCRIHEEIVDGISYVVLEVNSKDGKTSNFALPDDLDAETVVNALELIGVQRVDISEEQMNSGQSTK